MQEKGMNFLAKVFKKKQYMEEFLDGKLYMNCLGYFKNVEDAKNTQYDSKEGIKSYLQPHDVEMEIKFGDQVIKLDVRNLAAPVIIQNNGYNNLKIICFYSPYIDYSDLKASKEDIKITDKMKNDFGDHVIIITNYEEFSKRLQAALDISEDIEFCGHKKVDYFPHNFHGSFEDHEIPFKKHEDFSFQKEYRVIARTKQHDEQPLVINIGDLRDICLPFTVDQFNDIELNIKKIP
ncbi:hypothetical protein [Acinetobacter sp. ANC 5414]|uniref:hypothetical protein n=1 Tax=Acinetobacter sp. ANC 5414 TaxID=2731251 RepID=UPI001490818B|nr:hypothetical protein [Acinetobacter sp. ANC 5414]NNG99676.1 hypothetical protein [Acinetobacter sp. ANC 5414]